MKEKIVVFGGTGLVGHAIQKGIGNAAIYISSSDVDLRNQKSTETFFEEVKPVKVINAAGLVGGIKANLNRPYSFYIDNLRINTNVIDCCIKYKIKNFICLSSSCAYPQKAKEPITECQIHNGFPEPTNYGYAFAKRGIEVQLSAAYDEFRYKSTILYPSNLYGPYDNFDLNTCHMIPAFIKKFSDAKRLKKKVVYLWGSGKELRQCLYVGDLAILIKELLSTPIYGSYNYGPPKNLETRKIAAIVAKIVGYIGEVKYESRLRGVHSKYMSSEKIKKKLKKPLKFIELEEGIKITYKWYLEQENPI